MRRRIAIMRSCILPREAGEGGPRVAWWRGLLTLTLRCRCRRNVDARAPPTAQLRGPPSPLSRGGKERGASLFDIVDRQEHPPPRKRGRGTIRSSRSERRMVEGASDSPPRCRCRMIVEAPRPFHHPAAQDGSPSPLSRGRMDFYFSVNTSPLKSALTIRPVCSPESASTAPFWLASTMPCAPPPMAAPAPPCP